MKDYPQYMNRGFLANNTAFLKGSKFVASGMINTPEIITDDWPNMTWSRSLTVIESITTHVFMTVSRQSAGGGMYSSNQSGFGEKAAGGGGNSSTYPAVVQYGNFLDQQLSSATTCGDDRDFQSPGKRRFVKRSTD